MARYFHLVAIAITILLIIPGCTTPKSIDEEPPSDEIELPEHLNLIADTAGRDIDRGQQMDILQDADGENTLILWVSTGCTGCHECECRTRNVTGGFA